MSARLHRTVCTSQRVPPFFHIPKLRITALVAASLCMLFTLRAGGDASFDDPAQPIMEKNQPGEAHEDKLHALALFAGGCFYRDNSETEKALRQFQRAHQYDPCSRVVAEAAVEAADVLGRGPERDRYLLRLFELGGGDAIDLEELAFRTAMNGRLERGIEIYERLVKRREGTEREPLDLVMRWRLAEVYYLAGKYPDAAREAAWVVEALQHPQDYGVHAELAAKLLKSPHPPFALFGEFFLLADRPDQAREMFEKADAAEPDKLLLEFRLARVDAQKKEYEKSLSRLESCLSEGDKLLKYGMAPFELLEKTLDGLGRKAELVERLQKLYDAQPKNFVLGYALADCLRRNAQHNKAESLYKKLLAAHPSAVGYAGLWEIYRAENRCGDLLDLLGKAVAETESLELVGEVARGTAADAALIDKLADAARGLKADSSESPVADAWSAVSLLALDAKRFDLAGEFFDKIIKVRPQESGELVMIWSAALLAEERNEEAAAVLQRGFAEKLLADDAVPYYYLAGALAMLDRNDEALAASQKAAELKSDSPHFAAQKGWILYRAERYDEAAAVYEELLKRFDGQHNDEDLRETMRGVRLALAGIEVQRGNKPRAESLLEEVLDEFPGDVAALNDLGFLWADQNRHLEKSLRMTRKAVEAEADNAAYRDSLGWALFRLGRLEEAESELKKAAELSQDEEILKHLEEVKRSLEKQKK